MTVPNDWEQFQSAFNRIHNNLVKDFFRDDIDISGELKTTEQHLKYACTCRDVDDKTMTLLRSKLFQYAIDAAQNGAWYKFDFRDITSVIGHPRVTLFFQENYLRQAKRRKAIPFTTQSSFRLMGETFKLASDEIKIDQLANRIDRIFPESYEFNTGRHRFSYYDKAKGLQLIEKAFTKKEGEAHIKKILECAEVDYNPDVLKKHTNPNKSSVTPEKKPVLGEQVTQRRRTVTTQVRLREAHLIIPGALKPVVVLKRW